MSGTGGEEIEKDETMVHQDLQPSRKTLNRRRVEHKM
jgi:hypothetical protein